MRADLIEVLEARLRRYVGLMAQPELLPPVDPREDEWRVMMRDHATRIRILREEMEKQNPTPLGFRSGPWTLVAVGFTIGAALVGGVAGLTLLILIDRHLDHRPPHTVHVIIENGGR